MTLRDYLYIQSFLRDADHGVDGSRIQQVSERGVASQGRRLTQTDGRSSTRLRRARGSMWVSMPQCQRVKCHHHRPFHLRHVSARRWKPRLLPERTTATVFFLERRRRMWAVGRGRSRNALPLSSADFLQDNGSTSSYGALRLVQLRQIVRLPS